MQSCNYFPTTLLGLYLIIVTFYYTIITVKADIKFQASTETFLGQPMHVLGAFGNAQLRIDKVLKTYVHMGVARATYNNEVTSIRCLKYKNERGDYTSQYVYYSKTMMIFKRLDIAYNNPQNNQFGGRDLVMRRHIEIAHGQHYCFVLTYGSEQNLVQYLSEIPSWRKYEVLPNIFFQVVRATAYLHRASVVHNEIKPENILVNSVNPVNPKILLIDYDSADFLVLASPTTPPRASYCVGSPSYYPPECVEGKLHNPFRLSTWMSGERAKSFNPIGKDAWAIGATFYEVLFSKRTLNVKNLIEFSVSPRLFFRYLAIAKNFTRNRNSRQRMQQLIDEVAKFLAYKETDRPVPQKYLEANINNPLFI